MGNQYYNQIFRTARILFILDMCPKCRVWKKFIERINLDIRHGKKIDVVDVTNMNKYDIYDNPLLKIFEKHLDNFPTLFIDGNKLEGANSQAECESFIKTWLHEDFIMERENKFMFKADCHIIKKGFLRKPTLICDEEED